jgi:FtsP/CotA-like multicopper oxidase with cupredoxin domain
MRPHHSTHAAAALFAVALLAGCAAAQTGGGTRPSPAPGGPCAYVPIDVETYGKKPFQNPPEIRSANGRLETNLVVQYTDPRTTSLGGCPLTLRSYNGGLVGPTLRVKPGDVISPVLDNRLPRETPGQVEAQFRQEDSVAFLDMRPYSYNTTNLHTHGLHVSPGGNSDNVLLAISPQTDFAYDIALPDDHTRGSYWYHAHAHGSTAIQVGSAMAGALVVEDDPARIPAALRAANEREKVWVIQTMLYDTAGRSENIAAFFPDNSTTARICAQGGSGCTWQGSNRSVTVNGQIVPVIRMRPGEVQRWRVVDGSFRETIGFRVEGHALHEIATDGIYTGRVDTWIDGQDVVLFPGYRSDLLIQAGAPGTYNVLDDSNRVAPQLRGVAEDPNVIAILVVEGAPMDMRLPTQAEMAPLAPFAGVDLSNQAVRTQEAVFKLGGSGQATDTLRNSFQINYQAFNEQRVRYLQLDSIDMWSLTTVGDPAGIPGRTAVPPLPHVFHIHINPFQVQRLSPTGAPQWVWKDTQIVPAGDTITMYTQYTDFTGTFVIHCHILDHEDLGMMEAVEVVRELPQPHPRPDTRTGGAAHGHGSH